VTRIPLIFTLVLFVGCANDEYRFERIERCRQAGYKAVVVLGDPAYYSRFGFERAADFRPQNEYGVHDEFMVLPLRDGALKAIKGMVKYLPEFGPYRERGRVCAESAPSIEPCARRAAAPEGPSRHARDDRRRRSKGRRPAFWLELSERWPKAAAGRANKTGR